MISGRSVHDDLAKAPAYEIRHLSEMIPEYFARQNAQVAQLEAFQRNRAGGKRPAEIDPKNPPPPPLTGEELYTGAELLEPNSWFVKVRPDLKVETLIDLQANADKLPKWASKLIGDYLRNGV